MLDIEEIRQYAERQLNCIDVYVIKDDRLQSQSRECELYFKQLDESRVDVTCDTGVGHVIALLCVDDGASHYHITVKHISYFGDLLNIVNLRRRGFVDDRDMWTAANYNGSSTDFFKTHAKKYPVTKSRDIAFYVAITRAIETGMKRLYKTGMSNEALVKKCQHEQAVVDHRALYDVLKMYDDTPVQTAIKSCIDEQHSETVLKSHTFNIGQLFTNPYTNETYSRIQIIDAVLSNPNGDDKSKMKVQNGMTFMYTMHLDNATQELSLVDYVDGYVPRVLEELLYRSIFENMPYVNACNVNYNAKREILDKCAFMRNPRQKVSLEEVKQLVQAFIESIDNANKLVAIYVGAAID